MKSLLKCVFLGFLFVSGHCLGDWRWDDSVYPIGPQYNDTGWRFKAGNGKALLAVWWSCESGAFNLYTSIIGAMAGKDNVIGKINYGCYWPVDDAHIEARTVGESDFMVAWDGKPEIPDFYGKSKPYASIYHAGSWVTSDMSMPQDSFASLSWATGSLDNGFIYLINEGYDKTLYATINKLGGWSNYLTTSARYEDTPLASEGGQKATLAANFNRLDSKLFDLTDSGFSEYSSKPILGERNNTEIQNIIGDSSVIFTLKGTADGGLYAPYASIYRDGLLLSEQVLDSSIMLAGRLAPKLATNTRGMTIASWISTTFNGWYTSWHLDFSILDELRWSQPIRLPNIKENASSPSISLSGDNVVNLAWVERSPCLSPGCVVYDEVKFKRYKNGAWMPTETIYSHPYSSTSYISKTYLEASRGTDDVWVLWKVSSAGQMYYRHGSSDSLYNLQVSTSGDGIITSNPAGINCGSTCSAPFSSGTPVTLTPSAGAGYTFTNWAGACSGLGACTVTMSGAKSVSAVFTASPVSATLTVSKTGDGTITSNPAGINCGPSCSASFSKGTTVILTASAGSGYRFAYWTGACSGSGICTVNIDGAKSVGAIFTAGPVSNNYSLTVSKSGSGTITSVPATISCGSTCSGQFVEGSNVSLIAQPDYGFAFSGWSGDCAGTGTCVVTMDGNKSASANFIELPKYPVKITKPSTGVIRSEPAGILCGGPNRQCSSSFSSAKLTATPNPGYEFVRWTGCQAPEGSICYIKPSGKMTVKPVFRKLPKYNVKISKNNLGSITSIPGGLKCPDKKRSCSVKFIKGTQVTLAALPQAGRTFGGWTGACSGLDACSFVVDGNKGIGATFQ